MNDSTAHRGTEQKFQIGIFARNVIGALVVAGFLALVGNQFSNRERISVISNDIRAIKVELLTVDDFHTAPRFTLMDHQNLIAPITLGIDHLSGSVSKLEARLAVVSESINDLTRQHYDLKTRFGGLPPIRWQQRVADCEGNVSAMREQIRSLQDDRKTQN